MPVVLMGLAALLLPLDAPASPAAVVGGQPSMEPVHDAVVRLVDPRRGVRCSGVLVEPDLVLTAAHCLDPGESTLPLIAWGSTAGQTLAVSSVGRHPGYCPDCESNRFDYGYVRLEREAPMVPIDILRTQQEWDVAMRPGMLAVVVGYGETSGDTSSATDDAVRRQVAVEITDVNAEGLEFDAGGGGRDSCAGDSGGPALVSDRHGGWRVAGIASRGGVPCGDGGVYSVAYHALPWLSDVWGRKLCGDGCPSCACLQTEPDPAAACSVASGGGRAPWGACFVVLALYGRRRTR